MIDISTIQHFNSPKSYICTYIQNLTSWKYPPFFRHLLNLLDNLCNQIVFDPPRGPGLSTVHSAHLNNAHLHHIFLTSVYFLSCLSQFSLQGWDSPRSQIFDLIHTSNTCIISRDNIEIYQYTFSTCQQHVWELSAHNIRTYVSTYTYMLVHFI